MNVFVSAVFFFFFFVSAFSGYVRRISILICVQEHFPNSLNENILCQFKENVGRVSVLLIVVCTVFADTMQN